MGRWISYDVGSSFFKLSTLGTAAAIGVVACISWFLKTLLNDDVALIAGATLFATLVGVLEGHLFTRYLDAPIRAWILATIVGAVLSLASMALIHFIAAGRENPLLTLLALGGGYSFTTGVTVLNLVTAHADQGTARTARSLEPSYIESSHNAELFAQQPSYYVYDSAERGISGTEGQFAQASTTAEMENPGRVPPRLKRGQ